MFNLTELHFSEVYFFQNWYFSKQFRFAPSFNNQTVLISEMKMNIVDAQNACLSGGVAVGAIADLSLQPYGAVVIGSAVGILSTIGYQLVQVRF